MVLIYCLECKNKNIYVGYTKNKKNRFSKHKNDLKKNRKSKLYSLLRKLKVNAKNFDEKVKIHILDKVPKKYQTEAEKFYIKLLKTEKLGNSI